VKELKKREKKIDQNNNRTERLWYENGLIMLSIRDDGLYKDEYGTFEEYLSKRWDYTKKHGYRLTASAEFMQNALKLTDKKVSQNAELGHFSPADLPKNERQIRPLIEKLDNNGERLHVWSKVVETGEKPSQRLVEEKIAEFRASGVVIEDVEYTEVPKENVSKALNSSSASVLHSGGDNDECYTPDYAVKAIIQYLKPGQVIWCPFDTGSSQFVIQLKDAGFEVISSHISEGKDFYTYEPEQHWDVMVSNPPFTNKREIFERAIGFNKPFALVMSNTWLNDAAPKQIFRGINFQLLMFEERMKFLNHDNSENKITFSSSYFCRDFLPETIVFDSLKEYGYGK
jgi:hypothetical protein